MQKDGFNENINSLFRTRLSLKVYQILLRIKHVFTPGTWLLVTVYTNRVAQTRDGKESERFFLMTHEKHISVYP